MLGEPSLTCLRLAREIAEHQRVEEALRERAHLATLSADIGLALAQGNSLRDTLQRCAEAVVHHLDAAFARIWTLNPAENILELQASAGLYTHIDGPHRRVPVGQYKIGLIAQERKPHLTNSVIGDPRVHDQEWARREGLTAFVGHPLLVDDQVVGVLALFSRHRLNEATFQGLVAITNNIAIGIERKRAEEALRQSEKHFRSLIEYTSDIITILNDDGTIRYQSPSITHLLGYEPEELLGKSAFAFVHPDEASTTRQFFTQVSQMGKPSRPQHFRFQHKDGSWRMLEAIGTPLREEAEPAGLILNSRDITERKQLEAQLAFAQKMESIGQLAAGIAHEINTPAQYVGDNTRFLQDAFADLHKVLRSYAELLNESKANTVTPHRLAAVETLAAAVDIEYLVTEIPRAIEQSLQGIDRISKIVRAMKEFSHPGTEEKVEIDLNHAIETTITVARNEWKYVAEMVTDFDPALPLVRGLPGELNQVILNLIVNAAHAITDVVSGGTNGKGTITVGTRGSGDWVEIRISDTGTGIPEAIRTKIFDPFFTTKGVGKGTGQGLAIAHSVIVDKHSGTITYETERGKGTTFIIRLPLIVCASQQEATP
jgi:PAS domain S-box-containing protein